MKYVESSDTTKKIHPSDEIEVLKTPYDELPDKTVVLKVPVRMLGNSEGTVAKEVLARNGAVILPVGVDITIFEASMGVLIKKMEEQGIEFVHLHPPQMLSEHDINEIIERVYSNENDLISKEKAVNVIKGVDNLFHNIREDDLAAGITTTITNMSQDLTEDLLRNPSVAFSLGKVQEADEYTFVHSFNVAILTGFLANRIHPGDRDFLQKIVMGSLIHDIGKAKIPLEILNKPAPLSPAEFTEMKRHPSLGVSMALKSGVTDPAIIAVIGGHHEKWSGKGYPKGKKGFEIPESARIAAVADVFDALTAKRVYKNSMSSRNAITLILKDSGFHFDIRVARELLVSLGLYPPGSIVALSDGRVGIVVSGGGKDLVRPVILLQETDNKKKKNAPDAPVFVDLKNAGDICISQYLGHGEKRDLKYD
ncbi:MAG: HD domain-containing protein [Synergistaceae bacterium]|jgi:HD-GYP domain-containing protein (c-di-GMP phosphodiesterase class II)|nr:HD domain-containing protein [Synergistaceae bacterium]